MTMLQTIGTSSNVDLGLVREIGYISENSSKKIPIELRKECEDLYKKTDTVHIILDISDNAKIASALGMKDLSREIKINSIIDCEFEVVPWFELLSLPSRYTFYDSITKNTDLFERHKYVLEFMNSIDFKITNLLEDDKTQQEILWDCYQREYSYTSISLNRFIIRIKPNLMVAIMVSYDEKDSIEVNKRYFSFFDPSWIFKILTENSDIQQKRNLKFKSLYNEIIS